MNATTEATWTYEGYWYTVIGQRSASQVIAEFELVADGLEEWLACAEVEAWRVGGLGGPLPEEWDAFNDRALEELREEMAEAPCSHV